METNNTFLLYGISKLIKASTQCQPIRSAPSEKVPGNKGSSEKDVAGPPESSVVRITIWNGGSWFHSDGPILAKARDWAITVLTRGTNKSR